MPVQAIPAQRWVRIIPAAFLMYTIAFIDRNNIAFGFFGMQKDLAIGATASGIAGGIFFFGYLFLQVPGSLLAENWSAKRFITARASSSPTVMKASATRERMRHATREGS